MQKLEKGSGRIIPGSEPLNKTFVIAECGINHGGDLNVAMKMVVKAADAGADMAKFQSYRPKEVLGVDSPYLAEADRCQFNMDELILLDEHCDSMGIEFGCSFFHADQIKDAEKYLGLKRYKVASRAALNHDFLAAINKTGKPVIMSCGLLPDGDSIQGALSHLADCPITLLHCVCDYPTSLDNVDLDRMNRISRAPLGRYEVGFSSHCPEMAPTIAAVARGAVVTENHVKLDDPMKGCDMSSSMPFSEFRQMVRIIRDMERL